ncbi:hypothetical protein HMPREF1487_09339 [Pseudomonas sp. HPB0071]|uniref:Plasmid replication protein n=1 Tax=Pseudomonas luteola TaxID=47886 RepID=A0A2X2BYG4_PSELU|nr:MULTISPECIES: replication protein C, IncQ-type [Pseudomonas]ENA27126.1 hypothetical protein HMPREF1487_09339 [Pseudomonas sp. HPB0071]MBA1250082.1 plasmid replication protein [Pseudomonas zeshuii]MBH3441711.1 plasmid replication protein [Pseudomonas luteola]SPZ00033.1 Uncharacterised protein [Pseudomonas luteola]
MADNDIEVASSNGQLDLFELIEGPTAKDRYSNTIELYDALPKYSWSGNREFHDLKNARITRQCTLRGVTYNLVIKPAIIEKNGVSSLIYPGQREEFIEEALRKFVVSGQGHVQQNDVGVTFTLYQLREELKSLGHTYSLDEIKEAINVCRGASIECSTEDNRTIVSSNLFSYVMLRTISDYRSDGGETKCYVAFNPLVSRSIRELTFRRYKYSHVMMIKSPLARFFYKRMSHYWTQASATSPYTPSLVSFLSQSPRGLSENMGSNIRAMKNAFEVLITEGVIDHYDDEPIRKGRAIIDVRYKVWPTEEFVKQIKGANHHKNMITAKVEMSKVKKSLSKT